MVKPKIGLSMLYCLGEPFEKMAEQIPKVKTKCIELVDDGSHALDREKVSILNNIRKSYSLEFTVHAPFAGINIALPSKPLLNATLKRLKESIVCASALECRIWVFHPGLRTGISNFYPGEDWARNTESIRMLFRFANDHGVEAALENVMDPSVMEDHKDLERFYGEVDVDIGLVFDTGHANITGELQSYLNDLGGKIVHVHAHDNFGKNDQHLGIGYGNIDWKKVLDLLRKASYDRVVVIESVEHIEESVERLEQMLV